jgi:hypothetical protein
MVEDKKEKKESKAKGKKIPADLLKMYVTDFTWSEERLRAFMEREGIAFED